MARNFFRRTSRRRVLAGLALLLGLWITLAPFARPLPGGAPYTLEATPEILSFAANRTVVRRQPLGRRLHDASSLVRRPPDSHYR